MVAAPESGPVWPPAHRPSCRGLRRTGLRRGWQVREAPHPRARDDPWQRGWIRLPFPSIGHDAVQHRPDAPGGRTGGRAPCACGRGFGIRGVDWSRPRPWPPFRSLHANPRDRRCRQHRQAQWGTCRRPMPGAAMRPELVVLAAGAGSRLGGLKQLEPVGPEGEKVLDYALYDARRAGVERVVFVIRRDFERAFHQEVGARYAQWMEVAYAFQELDLLPEGLLPPPGRVKPWGTAHALLAARSQVSGPFLAINADDFYGRTAFERLVAFLNRPGETRPGAYGMVAFRMGNTL